jgi:flagellar motility protein MotE (MotC chaperone)
MMKSRSSRGPARAPLRREPGVPTAPPHREGLRGPSRQGFIARLSHATELRLLPVLIAVATVALGVRVGDVAMRVSEGQSVIAFQGAKAAEEAKAEKPAPAKPAEAKPEDSKAEGAAAKPETPTTESVAVDTGPKAELNLSASEIAVLEALAIRRQALEKREKDMNDREALIKAAEMRVEQKIAELNGLKADIEKLLKKQNQEQEAQLGNLVKIYETMKPKDAARIFDEMEMAVLLEVLERMKAQKTAPILASMSARKANDVTRQLAQRRSLPEAGAQQAAAPASAPTTPGAPGAR